MRGYVFAMCLLPALLSGEDWRFKDLQTTGILGFNMEDRRGNTQPSVGLGLDFGLCRWLAITTGYSWNHIGSGSASLWFQGGPYFPDVLIEGKGRESKHDILGGLRFHVPTGMRITPYIAGLGGVMIARVTASAHAVGWPIERTVRNSMNRPAAGVGAGFEIHIGRGASFLVDAKAVRPLDMYWYGRLGFGFAYRPSKKNTWGF